MATARVANGQGFTASGASALGGSPAPIGWTGTITGTAQTSDAAWTAFADTMAAEILSTNAGNGIAQGSTAFTDPSLLALGGPQAASGLAVDGDPVTNPTDGGAAYTLSYQFAQPIPAGSTVLLWDPGASERSNGPFTFALSAALGGSAVGTAGWSFQVVNPFGGTPLSQITTDAAGGQVVVDAYNVQTVPDSVVEITTSTPIDSLTLVAQTIAFDLFGLALPDGGAQIDTGRMALSDGGISARIWGGLGTDTLAGTTGDDTITSGTGRNLILPGTGADLILSHGTDTILGGTGSDTIFATGAALVGGDAQPLFFVNGNAPGTVVGAAGAGPDIINGGAGGGLYAGGSGGGNVLFSGTGSSVLFGIASGDLLLAGGASTDELVAGAGNETLSGLGSSGAVVFYGGPGNDLMGGGSGPGTFIAGTGDETMLAGSGPDTFYFASGAPGRADLVFGFDPGQGDMLALYGADPAAVLAGQVVSGGSTVLTLPDHSTITFAGVSGLTAAAFA